MNKTAKKVLEVKTLVKLYDLFKFTWKDIIDYEGEIREIGDQIYMNTFAMTEDTCSATVLVTVVSRPAPDRICIDGGYKTDNRMISGKRHGDQRPDSHRL